MLDLDFFDSSSKFGVIKATVHKTGKLGFSSGAAKFMKLEEFSFFNIGYNKANPNDTSLYLLPLKEEGEKSFQLVKAGEYYYIYIKNVLMELKLDYKNESIIYDIYEEIFNDKTIYKLTRRDKK